ncbi:S-adenosyl-l-methionine hydroxide adenosyltransferase family protein [Actinomadura sp. 9N407]|uniref:S-adenosyl-l-methionine hydroxide adenosyltransferase family protein n=1 Tax=Actinomadura sp. 9N407 TaxID=3375154 RepID=UPI0037A4554C
MFVSLTTDFGHAYTAICAGVVATIAPEADVLVLSDEVTPYAITEGALLLRQALPYLPAGVHAAIIDPGVGTPRRPIAIRTRRGDTLVGPDNGLLMPAAARLGLERAYLLENPAYRLAEVSTSFHGRDVFSPAAAHLASGTDITELGPELSLDGLQALDIPEPEIANGRLTATVLYTDPFGSLILSAERKHLEEAVGPLEHGTVLETEAGPVSFESTYGSVPKGHPLLWVDSSGQLGLAVNQGSAAERFGLADGDALTLRGRPGSATR